MLTVAIFLAWWAYFARRRAEEFSLSERLLGAFLATIGQILATTFVLGWLHQLFWWPLGVLNTVIVLILAARVVAAKGGHGLHTEIGHTFAATYRLLRSSSALWGLGALALFISGWVIYLGQLLPPWCWDAWGYHLGWAAFAHQEGHLGPFDLPSPFVNNFPKNGDILFLWWIIGAGTERWANISQAPFAFASALACYLLARRVGARRVDAAATGLLVFSIPTVFHQMWMAMVDIAVMGSMLTSLAFLARRRLTACTLALAGLSAGFMMGTKGSTAYLFTGIMLFLIYRLLPLGMDAFRHSPNVRRRGILGALVIFGVMAFAFGSYFYLRNWVLQGNPTGEYVVKVGPLVLFEGEMELGSEHFSRELVTPELYDALEEGPEWPIVFDGFFDPQLRFYQGNRIGGWGAPWAVLMLPAIPVALIWALLRRRWSVLAIVLACVLPYLLFKYNHTWTRYHLPLIGAGTTAFGFILTTVSRTQFRRPLLVVAIVCMALTVYLAGFHGRLEPSDIFEARQNPYQQSDRFGSFGHWGDKRFSTALQRAQLPGTTLAFTRIPPTQKILALWNPAFTNRVVFVQYESDGEAWEADLRAAGADAVYVGPDSAQMEYARTHPQSFEPLYEGTKGGVYKLIE